MKQKIENTTKQPKLSWLFGANPSAIEQQESQGQQQLVNSCQLPTQGHPNIIQQYALMGIKVIGPTEGDDLFFDVELPVGWQLMATDHAMHSDLVDELTRRRAGIFYKASFYDRKAYIGFVKRISYSVDRLGFLNGNYRAVNGQYESYSTPLAGRVTDFDGKVLFENYAVECAVEYNEPNNKGGYTQSYKQKSQAIENDLKQQCLTYLQQNYPDFENVNAYW